MRITNFLSPGKRGNAEYQIQWKKSQTYRASAQDNGKKNLAAIIAITNKSYHRRKIQGDGKSANIALLLKNWSEIISKLHQTTNKTKKLGKMILSKLQITELLNAEVSS